MTVFAWILFVSCCSHLLATIVTSIFEDDIPGMVTGILSSVLAGAYLVAYLFFTPPSTLWTGFAIGLAALGSLCGLFCEGLYTKFVGFTHHTALIVFYILILC